MFKTTEQNKWKRLSECVVVGVDSRQIQWQESAGHQEITSERSGGQQRSSHLLWTREEDCLKVVSTAF